MKIGIIRFSSLGDVVLTTGVIREVKRELSGCGIVMITSGEYEEVFRNNPYLEKTILLEEKTPRGFLSLVRKVRGERFDLIADLHGNPRSFILSALSGSGRKLRYRGARRSRTRMIAEKRRSSCGHVAVRYFEPFNKMGLRSEELTPEIWIDQKTEEKVESLVGNGHPSLIAVAPGANRATKRWPAEEFGALSRRLAEKSDTQVVIVGDAKDMDVAVTVEGLAGKEVINLAGRTSVLELAGVLKRASLLVTNDSGPMHVAAAVSTPVVALFGPTVPEFGFSPLGSRDRVVEVDLQCRPCSLHGTERCGDGSFQCMHSIGADEVLRLVSDVLNGG